MASMFDNFPTRAAMDIHAWGWSARFDARVRTDVLDEPFITFRVTDVFTLYLSRETAERAVAALQSAIAEFDGIEVAS